MKPGWYPDPDDDNARRYWDGETWSAFLPKDPAPPQTDAETDEEQRQRLLDDLGRRMGSTDRTTAAAAVRESAARAARSCAVATCHELRTDDGMYCAKHGPKGQTTAGRAASSSQLVCPHCQTRGRVSSRQIKVKKGISGAKATGAVLTLGWSMLGTGLSRKERATERHCGNCGTTWLV